MARHVEFDQAKIIDKAQDLYWQKGYEATSIQDLVQHLEISRSSLYNTFDDKHTLFLRALSNYQEAGIAELHHLVAVYGYGKATIERIFKAALHRVLNDEICKGCFLTNSMVELAKDDTQVAELIMTYQLEMEEVLHQSILAAQDAGEIEEVANPLALARHLDSVLVGLNVIAKTRPDPQVLKDIVAVALSMLT